MFLSRKKKTGVSKLRAGFSLVEVNLALIIAAGGLLAVFTLFPKSLRQSAAAAADMKQVTFAGTLLETIAARVGFIDDVKIWNDPEKWWKCAVDGTGLPNKLVSAKQFKNSSEVSEPTRRLAEEVKSSCDDRVWYICKEEDSVRTAASSAIQVPPQYLIRIVAMSRPARTCTGRNGSENTLEWNETNEEDTRVYLPNRYIVSVVSTDKGSPNLFHREAVYSQEYIFIHRP